MFFMFFVYMIGQTPALETVISTANQVKRETQPYKRDPIHLTFMMIKLPKHQSLSFQIILAHDYTYLGLSCFIKLRYDKTLACVP